MAIPSWERFYYQWIHFQILALRESGYRQLRTGLWVGGGLLFSLLRGTPGLLGLSIGMLIKKLPSDFSKVSGLLRIRACSAWGSCPISPPPRPHSVLAFCLSKCVRWQPTVVFPVVFFDEQVFSCYVSEAQFIMFVFFCVARAFSLKHI